MAKSIIEKGIDAAVIALKDFKAGLTSAGPNSIDPIVINSKPRITAMLNNVMESAIDKNKTPETNTNYGYLFPWHAACIATWYKEAEIPIPSTGASSANGWIKFFAGADQFSKSPTIGAVVVYGTTEQTIEANHLGLVVKIDEGIISSLEVVTKGTTRTLEIVQINPAQVNRYILPAAVPETKKSEPAEASAESVATGEFYYKDLSDPLGKKMHLVYNQKKVPGAPWLLHCYGPLKPNVAAIDWDNGAKGEAQDTKNMKAARKAFNLTRQTVPYNGVVVNNPTTYSDLGNSGCGLHAAAAVFRMLTGDTKYNPGYLAQIGGNYHALNAGTYHTAFNNNNNTSLVAQCGCKFVESIRNDDEASAVKHMQSGGFIIASGSGTTPFTKGGHFIYLRAVVVNKNKANTWYVGNSAPPDNSMTQYTWATLNAAATNSSKVKNLTLYAISKA